ncbi:response regulator transcription factor [Myxosarcina sp. GI1]|uniref:response regulator transcription factor n=1 Tax=Myxosarcina sp. GI1 TaxID=1541065 RepID=UPI00055E9473|nr:response regulator [Myxosarcina sp. GI1]
MTKILVIEDELFVRENITELLEAEDFEVFSTENGILGVLWAQENLPDLVICDIMMPEISGHDVLIEMRQSPSLALTPFIFLTAMADKADQREGMELGADDYLTKPFTRDELLGAIEVRLEKQQKLLEKYDSEHQRAEMLEQRVRELEQLQLQESVSQEYYEAVLKLITAINLIEKIQPGERRDRNLNIVRETCAQEIGMLKKVPKLQHEVLSKNSSLSLLLQH